MKKLLLATVTLGALAAGNSAFAADIPAPVYKAPVMAPIVAYSWTGCYIGGNGGGLWARKDWSVTSTRAPITSQDINGWLLGGQVGCNYQVSSWVFGIQADYDWSNASGRSNDQIFAATDGTRIRSLGSVTGRVGYAWNRFLGYVKGGVAWERDNYDTTFIATGVVFSTASETRSGATVGVGGEYAFTDYLTGFVEYDYYAFGTRTNDFAVVGTTRTQQSDIRENKSVVKAGLNWKFNWWASAPVVSKY